ncbi:MAG: phosphoheptose isomerase [Rhodospirillaceae bacterium]|nr:MAG: phosphoheptose isomerase [Rhodospirillaceae bacterium]
MILFRNDKGILAVKTNDMTLPISSYVDDLCNALHGTKASDVDGQAIATDRALAQTVEMMLKCQEQGGKVLFVGNGGSASIASHIVVDLNNSSNIRAMALNDAAMLTCLGNDYGYEHIFDRQIQKLGETKDILIAISSSGMSASILNAISVARELKMKVITLSGFEKNNALRSMGDLNFYINSQRYGYVEISHLVLCHAIAEMAGDWRPAVRT